MAIKKEQMLISIAMQKCFRNGIKVYPIIKRGRQYIQVQLPDKTTKDIDEPVSGKILNQLMAEKYMEYANKL